MFESNPNSNNNRRNGFPNRRLIQALIVLCIAIAGLAIRDFWFSPESDSDVVGPEVPQSKATPTIPTAQARTSEKTPEKTPERTAKAPAPARKQPLAAKTTPEPQPATPAPQAQPAQSAAVAANRATVPGLDIEVIAGDKKTTIHPRSNATDLAITSSQPAPALNAAERAPLATTVPVPGPLVEGNYPVLAQQMKVRGSVVLQALIGSDGVIQDLRVLAGPGILTTAAREAVRSWKFRPYLVNGQPVETKAKITVNFTINVADTSASGD